MIALSVEGLTIKQFIEIINTNSFELDEFDQFLTDFYHYIRNKAINDAKTHLKQLEVIARCEMKRKLQKEFDEITDGLDEIILARQTMYEKNKYKGIYGNAKRKACNDQPKRCRITETAIQLRIMSEGF